ncbi:MAG: hypothetical protein H6727_19710 [Myxococcales bacterium]|nr:hypothetical protein [Myxococcales bacterium]
MKKIRAATPIHPAKDPASFEKMLEAARGARPPDERLLAILQHQKGVEERIAQLEREQPRLYEALCREAEISCVSLQVISPHYRSLWYKSWKEKGKSTQKFGPVRVLKHLRHGSMSSSTSVGSLPDQALCLIKRYRPLREGLSPQEMFAHQERMIQRLRKIQDARVEEVLDHFLLEDDTYVQIKPFLRCVSLWDWMIEHPSRRERVLLLQELARILGLLHKHQIAHMDLKPDQLLLFREPGGGWSSPPKMTLIDYDFSMVDGMLTLSVGSAPYYAPEQFDEKRRPRSHEEGKKADIYAFCVIVHRVLSERFPFGDGSTEPTHLDIHKVERDWEALDIPYAPLREIIRAGLEPEARSRPKLSKILAVLEEPALLDMADSFPTVRKLVPVARKQELDQRAQQVQEPWRGETWLFWLSIVLMVILFAFGRGC